MSPDRVLVERAMADLDIQPIAIEEFHRRRHGRQRARRIGSSVAVVLMLVAAVGAISVIGSDDREEMARIDAPARDLREIVDDLEPGRYFIDPDGDPSTAPRVSFTVAGPGWTRSAGVTKVSSNGLVRLAVSVVPSSTDRCDSESGSQPSGTSIDDLAKALSDVGALDVTEGPRARSLLGYSAVHLQFVVPAVYVGGEGERDGVHRLRDRRAAELGRPNSRRCVPRIRRRRGSARRRLDPRRRRDTTRAAHRHLADIPRH